MKNKKAIKFLNTIIIFSLFTFSLSSICYAKKDDTNKLKALIKKYNLRTAKLKDIPDDVTPLKINNVEDVDKYLMDFIETMNNTKPNMVDNASLEITAETTGTRIHSSSGLTVMNICVNYSCKYDYVDMRNEYVRINSQSSWLSGLTLGLVWTQRGTRGGSCGELWYTYGVYGTIDAYLWVPIIGNTVLLYTYTYDSGTCTYYGAP